MQSTTSLAPSPLAALGASARRSAAARPPPPRRGAAEPPRAAAAGKGFGAPAAKTAKAKAAKLAPVPPADAPCPCGSGAAYSACCGVYHAGAAAPTPEALMRARYSAFARRVGGFILATTLAPGDKARAAEARAASGADGTVFDRFTVESTEPGASTDEAFLTFETWTRTPAKGARAQGVPTRRLRERARFVREGGTWLYAEGVVEDRSFPELYAANATAARGGKP